ncbi:MAG: isocitrate lyase [Gemmatimonadota bacterium]
MTPPPSDDGRPGDVRSQIEELERSWEEDSRWEGIERDYTAEDVVALRGSLRPENTIARHGSERLRRLLEERDAVRTLGALTGAQAVQMIRAGLEAVYVSGWQVAGDMNRAGETYPDMSLYPSDSVPALVQRLNNALQRADQIDWGDEHPDVEWMAPIVADAEAGFGGPMHAFELTKGMIDAGAAAVHFEDQLASEKKCGHMGGKVLVPTAQFIRTLNGARLAADVLGVPTVIIARTDADAATLLTNDVDPRDHEFLTGERTEEGYHRVRGGPEAAEKRALAYAPYADLVWCETSTPDLEEARRFAEAIHAEFPGKPLAYNCSPSFNWARHLEPEEIDSFHRELAEIGYCFQFVTLAGWHLINLETFRLARAYRDEGMKAYVRLQQREFEREADGYTAVRHQREVGAGYFDRVMTALSGGDASTTSLAGSTEEEQFSEETADAGVSS